MKHLMIGIIKLYRKFISPLKPPCCRFTPSCSQYALDAFMKRGFFVGFGLTVYRILRCNPFSKGGEDPVPEKPDRKRKKARKEFKDLPLALEEKPSVSGTEEGTKDESVSNFISTGKGDSLPSD